jgi:hypothetical protein
MMPALFAPDPGRSSLVRQEGCLPVGVPAISPEAYHEPQRTAAMVTSSPLAHRSVAYRAPIAVADFLLSLPEETNDHYKRERAWRGQKDDESWILLALLPLFDVIMRVLPACRLPVSWSVSAEMDTSRRQVANSTYVPVSSPCFV